MTIRPWLLIGSALAAALVTGTVAQAQDPDPPVAWWTFDNALNLGEDLGPGNHMLTNVGDPMYDPGGRFEGALLLDGVEDALTGSPFTTVPTGNDEYSISAWVKPVSVGRRGIVGWGNYGGGNEVNAFRFADGHGLNNYWWGNDLVGNVDPGVVDLLDGEWHHVAASFLVDANDTPLRRLFLDGEAITQDAPSNHNATADNFFIGKTCHGCGFGEEFYDGLLDDLAIFDYGISAVDAAALASGTRPGELVHEPDPPPPLPPPPGLVSVWRFDNPLNLGEDSAPTGNHLETQGDLVYDPSGVIGGAGAFDGVSAMLTSPDGFPEGIPVGDDPYTITAWILPEETGARGIVGWGNYGSVRQVNALRVGWDNGFRHYWWGADLDAQDVSDRGVDLDAGEWSHIAATYDGEVRQLYLNGELLVEDVPGSNGAQPLNFAVGRTAPQFDEFWNGLLDDVAIFRGALDEEELLYAFGGDFDRFIVPNCDFNNSGVCDVADLDALLVALGTDEALYDMDRNGTVELADRDVWLNDAGIENNGAPYVLGDTDLNGVVDAGDLNNLALSWQATQGVAWGNGDFNGDVVVNAQDLNDIGLNWQHGVQAAAAVPEPASALMVVMGLVGLIAARRRTRR